MYESHLDFVLKFRRVFWGGVGGVNTANVTTKTFSLLNVTFKMLTPATNSDHVQVNVKYLYFLLKNNWGKCNNCEVER